MPRIHQDFTAQNVQWFVRGTKLDGTRWESGHKHATRKAAEAEIDAWGPEMGVMKVMVERKNHLPSAADGHRLGSPSIWTPLPNS